MVILRNLVCTSLVAASRWTTVTPAEWHATAIPSSTRSITRTTTVAFSGSTSYYCLDILSRENTQLIYILLSTWLHDTCLLDWLDFLGNFSVWADHFADFLDDGLLDGVLQVVGLILGVGFCLKIQNWDNCILVLPQLCYYYLGTIPWRLRGIVGRSSWRRRSGKWNSLGWNWRRLRW